MAQSRFLITAKGAEELRKNLKQLKSVERPQIILAIQEARAHGDLSENAEYKAAKERQSFIEGRIQEIEMKLSLAEIIDPSSLNADGRCVFGATVTLFDIKTKKEVVYQIVGEDEADLKQGKISVNSPLARALIGKSEGDAVIVEAPKGNCEYEIVGVDYT